MQPSLHMFRSLWGATSDWETLFPLLRAQGFAGIEASLSDLLSLDPSSDASLPTIDRFFNLLRLNDLQWICGLYTSWDDYIGDWDETTNSSVEHHFSQFRDQLSKVVNDLPIVPVHINCHTGSDCLSESEAERLFACVFQIQDELLPKLNARLEGTNRAPVNISHETHRGRTLFSPWTALRLARRFPQIRFTLDLSHWTVVSERMLTQSILQPILDRTLHVHARVGSPQHPQVDDPSSDEDKIWTYQYMEIWKAVWRKRKAEGDVVCFVTPEYGPVDQGGYMREAIVGEKGHSETRRPLIELEPLVEQEATRLRTEFEKFNKNE